MSGSTQDPLSEDFARDDGRAFETLYVRYNLRLRLAAWRLCRRNDWIDDLTSESWRRAFEARSSFDRSRSFLVWLIGIMRNVYREQRRGRLRMAGSSAGPNVDSLDPAALADEAELLVALNDCVRGLSPEDQQIVRARFFEGLTLRAVAEKTGIPESTIRESRLPAICRHLKNCLHSKGLENSLILAAQDRAETQVNIESERSE